MPIRLSKACKDLNVGMTTAVEFLAKKGHKITVDPNLKLSDELHLLLAKEFDKDMAVKMESERLSFERHLKEKAPSVGLEGYVNPKPTERHEELIPITVPEEQKLHIKPIGHIDLDALTKSHEPKPVIKHVVEIPKTEIPKPETQKPVEVVVEEKVQQTEKPIETTPVEKPLPEILEKEIIIEKIEIKPVEIEKIEPEIKEAVVIEEVKSVEIKKTEVKPSEVKPIEVKLSDEIQSEEIKSDEKLEVKPIIKLDQKPKKPHTDIKQPEKRKEIKLKEEPVEAPEVLPVDDEIFKLKQPVFENTMVIVGNIDLNLLNQNTRPKPKTKEQKRKEREEKSKQVVEPKKPFNGEKKTLILSSEIAAQKKKKRERFTNQRVDISKVSKESQNLGQPKKPVPSTGGQTNAGKPNKDRIKRPLKPVVNEEEVQKQIKETLARLASGNKKGKGAKYRRDKRESLSARMQEQAQRDEAELGILKLTEFVTVSELATMMDVSVNQVIATCMSIGMMVSINQRLDAETINIVAEEFGFTTQYVSHDLVEAIGEDEPDTEDDLQPRAPIVTVMGHVDHGKTSLLDYIRKTNVIAGEAGGITQHIGAYNVKLDNGHRITFLDTPGHEAFTAMRARGAKVTDIAIIIVAADDNVMPQTIEAINHASAANVPMVFAINKVDKPGANAEKIKETLANMNYLVEDWGGKYQSQDISAKQGSGIAELLEKVLLEAEMLDLKANPDKRASGSVIESSLDKGRGYVSTILVANGTLRQGDVVLCGINFGKVKAMFNERNQRITEAKPAEPVLILGLNGAPQAGDNFNVMATEQEAREIANKREQLQREQSIRTKKHFTLDELGRRIALGDFKEMNIIVKGDVDGSIEALSDSLLNLSTENIQINVIHKAVGAISDSDILLAAASNAIICGFQVRPTTTARKMAEKEEIDIRLYSIIYDAIEEIKSAMEGMLSPEIKEEITATVEVLSVFKITKVGTIAGCLVRDGKIKRSNKVRVIRDGIVIYTGELDSLKRFKDDVKDVGTNYECGLNLKNYNDVEIGDIIESYEETEVKKTL